MGQLLISLPIFLILSALQTVAVSRIEIIGGSGDIVMLALIAWTIVDEDGNYLGWSISVAFLFLFFQRCHWRPCLAFIF